jgi:hypothetical protein
VLNKKISVIINTLDILKKKISSPETNILYSRFDTKDEVINELDTHIQRLQKEDFSKIEELIILFAPTGDLQEISISSGWGQLYLTLSERFDLAIKDVVKEFNLNLFS